MSTQLLTELPPPMEFFEPQRPAAGERSMTIVLGPLVLEFSAAGFPVVGFDIDTAKVAALKKGRSYIRHLGDDRIRLLTPGTEIEF